MTYSIDANSLPGATLDPATGVLVWTPTNDQIPSTNRVTVRVTDNATPALSATRTFQVIAIKPPPWKYLTTTGTATASLLYVYLVQPGEVYIDDLKIVAGSQPDTGANTVSDGDFETALTGPWTVSANHAASAIVTNVAHSGNRCLHLVATTGGTSKDSSVYQTITPALTANDTYTLSFWYMAGTNDVDLVIRLSGFGILSSNTIVAAPNNAPMIAEIADQEIAENAAWSLQLSATDVDLAQSLSFSLTAGAPSGMKISTGGLVSWTPSESQGPATNAVTVKVTDNGSPALSATRTFTVVVKEVNSSPGLAAIDNKTIQEGSPLSFAASATDSDVPVQNLTFSLDAGAPAGASITPAGVFSWTPTKDQGPNTYKITVRVTDGGTPALSDAKSFSVVVTDLNTAPSLEAVANQVIPEGTAWSLTLKATDTDNPAQSITYSLETGPVGMKISSDGILTWTPTESQGPSTNAVTVKITDSGSPALSATRGFTVTVTEVNSAPSLDAIANQSVRPGSQLSLSLKASDADIPAQTLAFSLDSAPTGMSVTREGVLTWTPAASPSASTNPVTVRVTDNGTPPLAATRAFEVVVPAAVSAPRIASIQRPTANGIKITWTTETGITYRLQYKHLLTDSEWTAVGEITATGSTSSLTDTRSLSGQSYYRVLVAP